MLMNPNGQTSISTQYYAVAMIDEVGNPKHIRQRLQSDIEQSVNVN